MNDQLQQQVGRYRQWRDELIHAIGAYQDWMDRSGRVDAQQSLRIYDLLESLRKDRLTLAFVAEFSRGKTELINALFFSDFKQRLLPSDVGRTTMCPTEIFFNPDETPYLRLLPIDTRRRDEGIAGLKRTPVEWSTIRLDPGAPEQVLSAMQRLTQTKRVSPAEARALGLWEGQTEDGGQVEIPQWRYAQINYPHPLLEQGLSILDTPGLNALGTEPELTLHAIPNAHAVLFLLATDTGVTKSDMDIWTQVIAGHVRHRVAVLNKIDTLWDDLKSREQVQLGIHRQLEATAKQLGLPASRVLAVSAQKALVAKIRGDDLLLERSGIRRLEQMLAEEVIPARQDIVRGAVQREIGTMMEASRRSLQNQLASARHELAELTSLSGKNQEVVAKLRQKILADKTRYDESVRNFNLTRNVLVQQGKTMLGQLDQDRLDQILARSRNNIEGSWTTAGLSRSMQSLVQGLIRLFDKTVEVSTHIKELLETAYANFHEQHQFQKLDPPRLDLARHRQQLATLAHKTEEFCKDPVNIMTEKRFLVRRFYLALISQVENVYGEARLESELWLRSAMDPLLGEIKEYRGQLERRLDNMKKIHENIDSLKERIAALHTHVAELERQSSLIEEIHARMQGPVAEKVTAPAEA